MAKAPVVVRLELGDPDTVVLFHRLDLGRKVLDWLRLKVLWKLQPSKRSPFLWYFEPLDDLREFVWMTPG